MSTSTDAGNPPAMQPTIRTVAAVIRDGAGRVLLARKRGSAFFIQPGGKFEPGEAALETLARELREELGVAMQAEGVRYLGEFEAHAVNEPGRRVRAEAWVVQIEGLPQPLAEIEQLAWVVPRAPFPVRVAPLSASHILPALRQALAAGALA